MGFHDDLAEVVQDPAIRRLAMRRARSRELAEDALQDTFYAVARTRHAETIEDLPAFFCRSLIRVINRQFTLSGPFLAEDIGAVADSRQGHSSSGNPATASVADEVQLRILAEAALKRLEYEQAELIATIPGRSSDPHQYRHKILMSASRILCLLFEGPVTMADWNAVLRSEDPQWCDQPGLALEARYQRLSRARADVQALLRIILPLDWLLT